MTMPTVLAGGVYQPLDLALGEIAPVDCEGFSAWCCVPG